MGVKKPITDVAKLPPMFQMFDIYLVITRDGKKVEEFKGPIKGMSESHAASIAPTKFGRVKDSKLRSIRYVAKPQKKVKQT